jgi:hypothetical protein
MVLSDKGRFSVRERDLREDSQLKAITMLEEIEPLGGPASCILEESQALPSDAYMNCEAPVTLHKASRCDVAPWFGP